MMNPYVTFDGETITLSRVPNTFAGGLATGATILAAILVEAELDADEIVSVLGMYKVAAVDVLGQMQAGSPMIVGEVVG
ncbi:hypothetical protein [Roseixanthobacter pseudopolyaromaticivorans]|uniref:hypothetical protein n=1 Tax=Xanthobacteraceae TaxID=335928 RepID=UPI003726CE97